MIAAHSVERQLVAVGTPVRLLRSEGPLRPLAAEMVRRLLGDAMPAEAPLSAEDIPDADPMTPGSLPPEALGFVAVGEAIGAKGVSANTHRTYSGSWSVWVSWCSERNVRALPAHPEAVRNYFLDAAKQGRAFKTIVGHLAAITLAHRRRGLPVPASVRLTQTFEALRRGLGLQLPTRAKPETLRRLVDACGTDAVGLRDRALFLLLYWACLSRAATVELAVEKVERLHGRLLVHLGEQDPRWVDAVPDTALCPVTAFEAWMRWRGQHGAPRVGPLFCGLHPARRGRGVRLSSKGLQPGDLNRLLKQRCQQAGLPPDALQPQNLRAEFAVTRRSA